MPPKKEFLLEFYLLYAILVDCFSSSSCQYGDRCKFLHASQQQAKPNAFGFGTQPSTQFFPTRQEQQKPNPFGFGIQNSSQPRGISDIGAKQNQFKPFENKWTRFSPVNAGSSPARQPDSQPPAANHTCTDPESCKRLMIEDFKNERPLWKLTCYGHSKTGPCDIVGDISYEELRAAAYTDAKLGLSLPSIVEKERNLLNSKLLEFESLLRNPCAAPPNSTISTQSPSAVASPNASLLTAQNSAPPAVSSFSQLGASLNRGFGMRRDLVLKNGIYVWQALLSNLAGLLGGQFPTQSIGSSVPSSTSSFSNSGMSAERNHSSFTAGFFPQIPSMANNQSLMLPSGPSSAGNAASESTSNSQLMDGMPKKNGAVDNVIWLKDEWNPGEVNIICGCTNC
ncbi:hypothetical protein RJ639_006732 [Escallonia herrerae]|uniref:C3H1-type domain-containing protein n=1 Tax=Escallonia herrerae TaxID=1293975 RepID=A0AA88VXV6_9ASTE|nr:hypothetical protein RJ639_006732 [Escallonia herrerae]